MPQEGHHPPQAGVGRLEERDEVIRHRLVQAPCRVLPQPSAPARLERAERLEEGGAELAVDRHRLAGRLHLHPERAVGGRELVERPARELDDDVVDGRLEGGAVPAGRRVRQLVEPLAEADEGRDPRDRVAGRLARQRGRTADARVDLDDPVVGEVGRHRQLDVAATLQPQRAHDLQRAAAQPLDDRVGQGLDRRHHDAVAGMDAHRVEVLHPADRDRGVVRVAQDLELDLVPAEQRALDEHLADGARRQAVGDPLACLRRRVREAAAAAAEREGRPDHDRRPQLLHEPHPIRDRLDDRALRHRLADAHDEVAEAAAILGRAHRVERRAEHADVVPLQHAASSRATARFSPVWPAERRQQRIGPMLLDDPRRFASVSGPMITVPPTSGSVITVAGFELTRIVSTPAPRSARQACTPA